MKLEYSTYTLDGVDYPVANMYTKGPHSFQRWDMCPLCGFCFPVSQFVYRKGKAYCKPNGCYRDLRRRV